MSNRIELFPDNQARPFPGHLTWTCSIYGFKLRTNARDFVCQMLNKFLCMVLKMITWTPLSQEGLSDLEQDCQMTLCEHNKGREIAVLLVLQPKIALIIALSCVQLALFFGFVQRSSRHLLNPFQNTVSPWNTEESGVMGQERLHSHDPVVWFQDVTKPSTGLWIKAPGTSPSSLWSNSRWGWTAQMRLAALQSGAA